jgi:hypothetical protein
LGGFALWTLVLYRHPTETEWGGFAQCMVYYLIGTFQSQTAVSLATLALVTSWETRSKFFQNLSWICLTFSTFMLILYIMEILPLLYKDFEWPGSIYAILINIVPVSICVSLILIASKKKNIYV